ncbi:hypothetical protein BHE74_00037410 [Ensete ventricosum]|nr:hypothetical protein BHE74_00037410 [Ensete ventricosum]
MSMNLIEEGCCVVNRDEDLTVIDFRDDVSLAEKLVRHEVGATKWMITWIAGPQRTTTDKGEESTPMIKSWSGAVDSVAEASIISKRLSFDSKKKADDNGYCYCPAWEQDAKLVEYHSCHLDCVVTRGFLMAQLAHDGRSKCGSGSGNKRPLGYGRGGRRRGAVVLMATTEGESSNCGRRLQGSRRVEKAVAMWQQQWWRLGATAEKAAYARSDKGGRCSSQTASWRERRSDPAMGASGCSAMLLGLKGTLDAGENGSR